VQEDSKDRIKMDGKKASEGERHRKQRGREAGKGRETV